MGEERDLPDRGAEGGLETSAKPSNQLRPKGWGKACVRARAADGGPRGELRVGFRPHLKSLSLDVIFSSKLEMWYEALAMLPASIPPAGAARAAARRRRRWGSSSRSPPRLPLPGSQRDADADKGGAWTGCPLPGEAWACPGGSRGYGAGLTTALLAGKRVHEQPGVQQALSGEAATSTRGSPTPTPSALAP